MDVCTYVSTRWRAYIENCEARIGLPPLWEHTGGVASGVRKPVIVRLR